MLGGKDGRTEVPHPSNTPIALVCCALWRPLQELLECKVPHRSLDGPRLTGTGLGAPPLQHLRVQGFDLHKLDAFSRAPYVHPVN